MFYYRVTDCSIRVYIDLVMSSLRLCKFLGGVAIIHLANSIAHKYCRILANSVFLVFDDRVILSGSTSPMDLAVHSFLAKY